MPATHSHFASPFVYYLDLHLFPTRRSSDLHGRPLIAGTTTVSGPTRVFSRGSIAAIECVFKQMKTASWTRSSSDRKSTRLNSSHVEISYAVFCLKKKKRRLRQTAVYREQTR